MSDSFEINCVDIGKKFGRDWIFKGVNETFKQGEKVAILGHNGSGKSTFLMSLAGFYALSNGKIQWLINGNPIDDLEWYQHYALISPLLELPDDATVDEFFTQHFRLKTPKSGWDKKRMYEVTGLHSSAHKFIKHLSSGMRQRLKLIAAFVPDVPVVFLDEPLTNLDASGIKLYHQLVEECSKQLILVASNMPEEYSFCDRQIRLG